MDHEEARNSDLLTPDSIVVPWYLRLRPLDLFFIRKRARRILSTRDAETVKRLWANASVDLDLRAKVSSIIANECKWPNALFVPDDRCSVVFCDPGYSMDSAQAMIRIEQQVVPTLNEGIWSELDSMSYE